MRISVPKGIDIIGLEDILQNNGVELMWVTPVDDDQQVATVLENIEMFRGNDLPGDTVVERGEGEFLVLDRFFSHETPSGGLIYGVQRKLTPEEFYDLLGRPSRGPCTADDISDHLVRAFDQGMAGELGLDSALFAYRAPDGRIMHQHST